MNGELVGLADRGRIRSLN